MIRLFLLIGLGFVALKLYLRYRPKLDITPNHDLILWYTNELGERVFKFLLK